MKRKAWTPGEGVGGAYSYAKKDEKFHVKSEKKMELFIFS